MIPSNFGEGKGARVLGSGSSFPTLVLALLLTLAFGQLFASGCGGSTNHAPPGPQGDTGDDTRTGSTDVDGADVPVLRVFAAASLNEVVRALVTAFEERESVRVELNLAGSNTLARQIRATVGPDVFLSADRHWMDAVQEAGRVVEQTRRDLFSNRLVLVARADSRLRIEQVSDLAEAPFRHLSVADPAAVPAGRYARSYLEAEGSWAAVSGRVVPALDVRAALGLVATDPEIVGIVYRTDVVGGGESEAGSVGGRKLKILAQIPPRPEIPIVYCGALLRGAEQAELGRRFLDLLVSPEGVALFERHGFAALIADEAHSAGDRSTRDPAPIDG